MPEQDVERISISIQGDTNLRRFSLFMLENQKDVEEVSLQLKAEDTQRSGRWWSTVGEHAIANITYLALDSSSREIVLDAIDKGGKAPFDEKTLRDIMPTDRDSYPAPGGPKIETLQGYCGGKRRPRRLEVKLFALYMAKRLADRAKESGIIDESEKATIDDSLKEAIEAQRSESTDAQRLLNSVCGDLDCLILSKLPEGHEIAQTNSIDHRS